MRKGKFLPLAISTFIMTIGIIALFIIYDKWNTQEISISNPIITKVSIDTQSINLKTIIHEAEKNVVQIEGQNEDATITGSGFLFNSKGDIITNAHVIKDADVIYVRTSSARTYPAAVVGIGENLDIAVVRVPQLAGQFLPIEIVDSSEIGDEIIALGSPHGFQNTVTLGIISGSDRNFSIDGFDYSNVYQISAQITHGNSGGPLINRETGKVIGINSVGTEDGTIGFSIPINEVMAQVEQWSNEAQNYQLDFASTSDIINSYEPEQLEDDATYLIEYFLDSIDIKDYVGAYKLLGSSMQSDVSYSEFREQYVDILGLSYSDVLNNPTEDNRIKTSVDITFEKRLEKEQDISKVTKEAAFTIGYENDQLKILKVSKPKNN